VKRREFITLLGGAAAVWPVAAHAQPKPKAPTIGFLGTASAAAWSGYTAAFAQRLRELGWIEGRTVVIEFRWSEGRRERVAEIAAEFTRLKVDVIVTAGSAVPALKEAISATPIVFAIASDPITGGLVASLSRPGSNVTGLSNQNNESGEKRLELLREMVPGLHRLAILANAGYPEAIAEVADVEATAGKLGLAVAKLGITRGDDIPLAFGSVKDKADALYVVGEGLVHANRIRIITHSLGARLPAIYNNREYVEVGGLMSYGANYEELFRRAAEYVDKILHGAKPGDLPVEQPTRFDLVLNLTTARVLGLEVPPTLLARANEVIE
jgi:putative ABC transport system substrate-binding protein